MKLNISVKKVANVYKSIKLLPKISYAFEQCRKPEKVNKMYTLKIRRL